MMRIDRVTSVFLTAAGTVLLAAVVILAIGNLSLTGTPLPPEPVFNVSLRVLFWIGAGVLMALALPLLFGRRDGWRLILVVWIAANYWCYRVGLYWVGCEDPGVLLAPVANAFGMNGGTLLGLADGSFGTLLVGGLGLLLWPGRKALEVERLREEQDQVKGVCPACGGHLNFAAKNVGLRRPCPHCQESIVLHKSDDKLKMSCFFCKGHIEFPSHAVGKRLKCPHCRKDITLMEQGDQGRQDSKLEPALKSEHIERSVGS